MYYCKEIMKRKIAFIFLCVFIFKNLNAQSYKQMLNHDSEWQLTVCNNGCITDIYFTDGDTLYNNSNDAYGWVVA